MTGPTSAAAGGLRQIAPETWCWTPWRNGCGRTVELHLEGAGPDWRLSLASIEGVAPFSEWPRLVLVRRRPLRLTGTAASSVLGAVGEGARFSGEEPISAEVGSRSTVLILMGRRASAWRLAPARPAIRIAHAITTTRLTAGGGRVELVPGATLIADGALALNGPPASFVMPSLDREAG